MQTTSVAMSHQLPASTTNSNQSATRKKRRGMIEKKRRDKINNSLSELRRLVPAAFEKQGSAKLEKAEILQMTVDYLHILHARGLADSLTSSKQLQLQAQQTSPSLHHQASQATTTTTSPLTSTHKLEIHPTQTATLPTSTTTPTANSLMMHNHHHHQQMAAMATHHHSHHPHYQPFGAHHHHHHPSQADHHHVAAAASSVYPNAVYQDQLAGYHYSC